MPVDKANEGTRMLHSIEPAGAPEGRIGEGAQLDPVAIITSLYSPAGRHEPALLDGHLMALVRLASGFQLREEGIVEHLRRIHSYVAIIAVEMGMTAPEADLVACASVLHDVGMVDVPERIVNKQGALTPEDQVLVRRHTDVGWTILEGSEVPLLDKAAVMARAHHEHFDGTGYPDGLAGDAIPVEARILGLADVLDALTTKRPFKQEYPFLVAKEIVKSLCGTHFDPRAVEAMEKRFGDIEQARRRTEGPGEPSRRGFRMSARDMDEGRIFSVAREGYFSCPYCKNLHPRSVDACPEYRVGLREIHKLSGMTLDGKYRLRSAIGVGGMGTVYEAEHVLIGRRLAVKFLDPMLAGDPAAIERFGNEARVFATVGHPNLVEVTDMGRTAEGIPYFVMELLEGVDLARLLHRHGRLPTTCAVTIAIEVLRTLEAVHASGVVHRDLKPENVFLARIDGRTVIKLLDFGISRLLAGARKNGRLTQQGVVFGTPQYMSPEQALGKDDVDQRSDLFTIGEILYEMLTGRCVFEGDNSLAILSAVVKQPIRPPSEIVADLPRDIEGIVMKALEKDPGDRWASASEFMRGLFEIASADPRFTGGKILDLPG